MTSKAVVTNTESNHVLLVTVYDNKGIPEYHEHLEPEESTTITLWDNRFFTVSEKAFIVGMLADGS